MTKTKIFISGKTPKQISFQANKAYESGDFLTATKLYTDILKAIPEDKDTLSKLGILMLKSGQIQTSSNILEKLLTLDPTHIEGLKAIADLSDAKHNFKASIGAYLRLIELNPEDPKHYYQASARYNFLGDRKKAKEIVQKGLEAHPENLTLLKAYCSLLFLESNFQEVTNCYKKMQEIDPDPAFRLALATLVPVDLKTSAEIENWRKNYEKEIDTLYNDKNLVNSKHIDCITTPFSLLYHGKNNRDLNIKLAKLYEKLFPQLLYTAPHCKENKVRDKNNKAKLGFVMKYFYDHVMNDCFGRLIAMIDESNAFDVYVFSTLEATPNDPLWSRFANKGSAIMLSHEISIAQKQIAEKELDVLVYTEIGMDIQGYSLAFSRLAPAQCVLTGHPETSGISNIDYYVSSHQLDSYESQKFFSEKLLLLDSIPDYPAIPEIPSSFKTREELNLDINKNIYLMPFKLHKVHPDFDEVLNNIFDKDPNAQVVIFSDYGNSSKYIKERFEANIRPEFIDRIKFFPWANKLDFCSFLKCSDVIIDSFYFGLGSTMYLVACIGTPVVTMYKDFFRGGRMARVFFEKVGLNELIAKSVNDYIDISVKVANDKSYQADLRKKIINNKNLLFESKDSIEEFKDTFLKLSDNPNIFK